MAKPMDILGIVGQRSRVSPGLWIFGYGSLVWRPAFPFAEKRAAYIGGWARRFWQGSTDHRGVPGAPGRVVTLTPEPAERCWGMGYLVGPTDLDEVLRALDHREQSGYDRVTVELTFRDGTAAEGVTYLATPQNVNYLGEAPLADMARQIRSSRGPSGSNVEYVLRLAEALGTLGAQDPHVAALAALVRSPPD
jgi:glutathione-specific gamma-glutamylcyclotransferase